MTKIHGGYVLQPRIFDKSEASKMSPVTRELWFYLLRNVNHSDNGKFKRGQGFFQFSDIQEDLHWYVGYRKMMYSKPQLTKALRRLCEGNMTATAKATRGIIITVLNYSIYQDPKNYEGNDEGSTKKQRRDFGGNTINKNGKNEKNVKEEIYTSNFLDFWNAYPRKIGKGKAFESYQKIKQPRPSLKIILDAIEIQNKTDQWKDTSFIPHPATWINQRRWEDEITPVNNTDKIKTKTDREKEDKELFANR